MLRKLSLFLSSLIGIGLLSYFLVSVSLNNTPSVYASNAECITAGGFKFNVYNVPMHQRINDGGKLQYAYSCFDKNGRKLPTDIRDIDHKRDWFQGKRYNFMVTAYLFNNGGHDRDVHEYITFNFLDGQEPGKQLAKIRLDHTAAKEPAFSLTGARVVKDSEYPANDYKNFIIVPNSKTPYGSSRANYKIYGNLVSSNGEIKRLDVDKADFLNNNGWDIKVTLKNEIPLIREAQNLFFSLRKSDNKNLDVIDSDTNMLIIPKAGPEIVGITVEPDMMGGDPKKIMVETANIETISKEMLQVWNNDKLIEIESAKFVYKGSANVEVVLNKPLEKGTVKVTYSDDNNTSSLTINY